MTTVSEQLMSAAVKRAQAAEIQVNGAVTRYWSYPALGTALGQIVFIVTAVRWPSKTTPIWEV